MEYRKKPLTHRRRDDAAKAADAARKAMQYESRSTEDVAEKPTTHPAGRPAVGAERKTQAPVTAAPKVATPKAAAPKASAASAIEHQARPADRPVRTAVAKTQTTATRSTVAEKIETKIVAEKMPTENAAAKKADKKQEKVDKKQKKQEKAKKKQEQKKEKKQKKKDGKPSLLRRIGTHIGNGAAAVVNKHDSMQASADEFFGDMGFSIVKESHDMRVRYKETGRKMMQGFFAVTLVTCMLLLVFEHFTVYEYAYNGRTLGYVKSQDAVTNILEVAGQKLSGENNINIKFKANDNVTMKKVAASGKDVDNADQVLNKLTYMTDVEVDASGVYEDGKLVAILENESKAKEVLNTVKKHFSEPDDGMKVVSADFKKNVEIKAVRVMITSVQSKKAAKESLENGGELEIEHIVNEGETLSSLSSDYGVSKSEIFDTKTDKVLNNVEAGETVKMNKTVSPVVVKLVESGTMAETVPFKTVKQNSADLYVGDTFVRQKGVDGRQKITGKLTKENGTITKRDIKKTEVITKSANEIILVGTKEKPKTAPTGKFAYPIRTYTITSYFGERWGRMHEGIDFAASTGTPIYASDGGTVTKAAMTSGYGNCVVINHGSGRVTLYGHCSKILVSSGDKVYQGQEIALVGSTGRSTGPHLHFEIQLNGTSVDPLKYL